MVWCGVWGVGSAFWGSVSFKSEEAIQGAARLVVASGTVAVPRDGMGWREGGFGISKLYYIIYYILAA